MSERNEGNLDSSGARNEPQEQSPTAEEELTQLKEGLRTLAEITQDIERGVRDLPVKYGYEHPAIGYISSLLQYCLNRLYMAHAQRDFSAMNAMLWNLDRMTNILESSGARGWNDLRGTLDRLKFDKSIIDRTKDGAEAKQIHHNLLQSSLKVVREQGAINTGKFIYVGTDKKLYFAA